MGSLCALPGAAAGASQSSTLCSVLCCPSLPLATAGPTAVAPDQATVGQALHVELVIRCLWVRREPLVQSAAPPQRIFSHCLSESDLCTEQLRSVGNTQHPGLKAHPLPSGGGFLLPPLCSSPREALVSPVQGPGGPCGIRASSHREERLFGLRLACGLHRHSRCLDLGVSLRGWAHLPLVAVLPQGWVPAAPSLVPCGPGLTSCTQ